MTAILGCNSTESPDLPGLNEITSMVVSIQQPEPTIDSFEIPESDWADILATLRSAKVDNAPAKWEYAGSMDMKTNSGKTVEIWIFLTSKFNAFAVQETSERVYYRSNTKNATVDAIHKSFSKSQESTDNSR